MPPTKRTASEETAGTLPSRAIGAMSLAALITASPHLLTALDQKPVAEPPVLPTTSLDSPPSGLSYPEMTALRKREIAVGEGVLQPAAPVDSRELLSRRILSLPSEVHAGPGGAPIPQNAIEDALRFLDLLPASSPVPHVSIADDGEINFFVRRPGLFVDIGFFGDGQIHYYVRVEALEIDTAGSRLFDGRSLPYELVAPLTAE